MIERAPQVNTETPKHESQRMQCQLRRVSRTGMERAVLDFAPDARGAQVTPSPKESMHRRPALSALLASPVIWFSDPEITLSH